MGVRMLGGVWGRAGLRRPYAPEASSPIHISGPWAFDAPPQVSPLKRLLLTSYAPGSLYADER